MWTRFNPTMLAVQKAIRSGAIGDVHALYVDHAADEYTKGSLSSRLLSPELAGGPLMDLGPYPMVWVSVPRRIPARRRSSKQHGLQNPKSPGGAGLICG